jgi:hypothetical protein
MIPFNLHIVQHRIEQKRVQLAKLQRMRRIARAHWDRSDVRRYIEICWYRLDPDIEILRLQIASLIRARNEHF